MKISTLRWRQPEESPGLRAGDFFKSNLILVSGILILTTLFGMGTFRAFSKGAPDFSVFYEAWRLVYSGKGEDIYRVSPDRFLYCPGFAWSLAFLGAIPKEIALGLWCLLKVVVLVFAIRNLS